MFERLLLSAVISATSVTAVACDLSEAAPRRPIDARPSADARTDGAVTDAPPVDAGPVDGRPADAATVDAAPPVDAFDVLYDSGEAPPLYDARLL
jgi:hypothetical protein